MPQKITSNLKQSAYDKKIKRVGSLLTKEQTKKATSLLDQLIASPDINLVTIIKIAKLIIKTGNFPKAIEYLKKAADLNRTSIEIFLLLAAIYKTTSLLKQAAEIYIYILKLDKDCIEANLEYGIILSMRGSHPEAIDFFNKCLNIINRDKTILPGDAKKNYSSLCYNNLGLSHVSMGKFDTAIEYYEKAFSIDNKNVLTVSGLANLYEKQGNKDKALETILILDKKHLSNVGPALVYAKLSEQHNNYDSAILYLDKAANRTADINEKYALYLQIGKLYEKTGRFDKSFSYYQKANNSMPLSYKNIDEEYKFSTLKKSYAKVEAASNINSSNKAVFILGMPRSGTSIVEQMLSMHKDIHACGEQAYFYDLTAHIQKESRKKYPEGIELLNKDFISGMSEDYFSYLDKLSSCSRVTDKLPHNFMHIGLINLIAPGSYIIHCKRSPIDTCLSCYSNEFSGSHNYSYRLHTLAHYYRLYDDLINHWRSTLNIKWLDVSYEAMVSDTESEIRRIVDFLELDWDKHCLEYYKSKRSIMTASYDQANKKIYDSSVGRWKNFATYLDLLNSLES